MSVVEDLFFKEITDKQQHSSEPVLKDYLELRDNKECVLALVGMEGFNLEYASDKLKNDEDNKCPVALRFATCDAVMAVVEMEGPCLRCASAEM